ncbi:MAG: hypothetical protein JSW44_02600, partial [Candidatus Bathyarchaeota archaeon]
NTYTSLVYSKQRVVQPKRVNKPSMSEVLDCHCHQRLEYVFERGKHSNWFRRRPPKISMRNSEGSSSKPVRVFAKFKNVF